MSQKTVDSRTGTQRMVSRHSCFEVSISGAWLLQKSDVRMWTVAPVPKSVHGTRRMFAKKATHSRCPLGSSPSPRPNASAQISIISAAFLLMRCCSGQHLLRTALIALARAVGDGFEIVDFSLDDDIAFDGELDVELKG